jgi:hypothetical protein
MNEQEKKIFEMRRNLLKSKDEILSTKLHDFVDFSDNKASKSVQLTEVDTATFKFKFCTPMIAHVLSALKEINNAPEELAIQAVLGTMNFATHSLVNIDPEFFGGRIIPITEFFVGLAPTAGMKSTIYGMLERGIARFEEDEKIRYGNEMQIYKLAKTVYQREYDKLLKQMTPQDMQDKQRFDALIASLGPEPKHPISPYYRLTTGTRNGLLDFMDGVPFGGMSSSEAGEFFNGHAFQEGKNNSKGIEMITTLTNLWDGNPVEKNTGIERRRIYNRRFMMLFLLQKATAKDWLGNKIYSEQGFVHRLLITHCDYWDVPDLDRNRIPEIKKAQEKLNVFHERIYELLKRQRTFKEDSNIELELPSIRMTDEAIDLLSQFNNSVKREQMTTYIDWVGFVGRIYEHAVRLSAMLAVFDGKNQVCIEHAQFAIELAYFYLDQRMTLDLGASSRYQNQVSVAEKLTNKIVEEIGKGKTIDKGWLNRNSPTYYRDLSRDERQKVLDEINSRGVLEVATENGKTVVKVANSTT